MSRLPLRPIPASAWLLALALLLAQGLGLAHRVLHAPGMATQDAVFSHHDAAECRLYDALAGADALLAAPSLLAPAPAPVLPDVEWPAGRDLAFAAAFLARGPPRG